MNKTRIGFEKKEGEWCCPRCGSPMTIEEINDFDDDEQILYVRFACGHCGMEYDAEFSEETSFEGEGTGNLIAYQGFGYCPNCGANLAWSSDFMRSEIEGIEDMPLEDDALSQCLTCLNCNTYITANYPWPKDEKNFPFYKEQHSEENDGEELPVPKTND